MEITYKTNIIFLDIDGVLNCQLFFEECMKNNVKYNKLEHYKSQLCEKRIKWFNDLCNETDSKVVISSTWRHGKTIEQLQSILNESGANFEIIDKTSISDHGIRGVEIYEWINGHKLIVKNYAIIDDDSDMLLKQAKHFFQTDNYSGLTPTTCHKIKLFFNNYI
jgi:hypothetical protein